MQRLAPDGFDGLVAAAEMSEQDHPRETIANDYFGAIAAIKGGAPLRDACPVNDEARAIEAIPVCPDAAYMSSKMAVRRWMRRAAIAPEWAGAGILPNGIAPGVVETAIAS